MSENQSEARSCRVLWNIEKNQDFMLRGKPLESQKEVMRSKYVKTITATTWRISTVGVQWEGGGRCEKAGWEIL